METEVKTVNGLCYLEAHYSDTEKLMSAVYQVWLPAEIIIPVPSFVPSSACPEQKVIAKVEYKFEALNTLSLPPWATFSESPR